MKIVIFEDEKENAERLIRLLQQCEIETESIIRIESVAEGINWFKQNGDAADLLFMDIQLSDGNCFEIFEKVNSRIPIIFITAYDSFALQAFKLLSVDYLMKPIDVRDLKRALEKYQHFKPSAYPQIDISKIAEAFFRREDTRFIGKMNNQLIYVKAKNIAYIFVEEGLTWSVTHKGQKVPIDFSLDRIEGLLDKSQFFRINRKMIIHIDAIHKITTYYNNRLVLELIPANKGENIISRERVTSFKTWLQGHSPLV